MWLKLDPTYELGYKVVSSVPQHFHVNHNLYLGLDGGLYFHVNGQDVRYDYTTKDIDKVGNHYFYYDSCGPRRMLYHIDDIYFYREYRYHGEKYSKIGSTYIFYDSEHNDRIRKIGDHNIYYDYNNKVNQIDSYRIAEDGHMF